MSRSGFAWAGWMELQQFQALQDGFHQCADFRAGDFPVFDVGCEGESFASGLHKADKPSHIELPICECTAASLAVERAFGSGAGFHQLLEKLDRCGFDWQFAEHKLAYQLGLFLR